MPYYIESFILNLLSEISCLVSQISYLTFQILYLKTHILSIKSQILLYISCCILNLVSYFFYLSPGWNRNSRFTLTCLKWLNGMDFHFLSALERDGWMRAHAVMLSLSFVLPFLPKHSCSVLSFPSSFCLFIFYSVSISLTSTVILLVLKLHVLMTQFIVCCSVKETQTKYRDGTNYKFLTSRFPQCTAILISHCFGYLTF